MKQREEYYIMECLLLPEGRYIENLYSYPFPWVDRWPFHSLRLQTGGVDLLATSWLIMLVDLENVGNEGIMKIHKTWWTVPSSTSETVINSIVSARYNRLLLSNKTESLRTYAGLADLIIQTESTLHKFREWIKNAIDIIIYTLYYVYAYYMYAQAQNIAINWFS